MRAGVRFQNFRLATQMYFAALCIWIGVEFALWLKAIERGDSVVPSRPPGVEAFLPISSLMNLRYWFSFGEIQMYHPAGVFIFLGIVVGSFFLGKFFCSWICPIGLLSEVAWKLKSRFWATRPVPLPHWVDVILRSLKYLLLTFFASAIFLMMDARAIREFLESPYNLVADAKMFDFFASLSLLAGLIIGGLFLLSLVVRSAWCRFLCPYGALLGVIGLLSPSVIRRNSSTCISCERCTKVCPSAIEVHRSDAVRSDECSSCFECLTICPAEGALEVKMFGLFTWPRWRWIPLVALSIYASFILWGVVTERWNNRIDPELQKAAIENRRSLGHPGQTGEYYPQK